MSERDMLLIAAMICAQTHPNHEQSPAFQKVCAKMAVERALAVVQP